MSARTATRRTLRSAAATAVVAAVAGTVLMPLSAYAAPAEGGTNQQALKITMGAPAPSGPLTRGGATETFELTVTNPSDKAHSFHPWILGDPEGPSPLQKSDVLFKVEAVDAPATTSFIGQQDGAWQGMFHPTGKEPGQGFEIPAGGKLTWKVTVGLGAGYPTNDGDFTLRPTSYQGEVAEGGSPSLTFKTDPSVKTGTVDLWFDQISPCQEKIDERQCREMDLRYRANGEGAFNTALATYLDVDIADGISDEQADLQVQVQVDGKWQDLAGGNGTRRLPDIAKGFGKASGERKVHLRAKLGPKSKLPKATTAKLTAQVGLAEGNTYPFLSGEAKFQIAPAATTTPSPSPSPSTSASPQPSTSPSPSASSTTAVTGNSNTTTTGGSLAHTGADSNTGLYSGLAAALVALGGAAMWLGARRRRAARV
ncbi:LPXTG cell wall anchor domain-containing protein [Streptomyces sp. NPDC006326]|uniref:LPXTG cell wall anchor domain-containing protein n=1 Tax=Streptomyces sp. NPDC006326 TaxID=3156752 RepID=UPI0033BDFAD5